MTKYIDAEKLKITLIDEYSFLPAFVVRAIEEAPAADVVSKETHEAVVKALQSLAETDVVQVVRCKDCKHRYEDAEWRMRCKKSWFMECTDDNYFCSYGER